MKYGEDITFERFLEKCELIRQGTRDEPLP